MRTMGRPIVESMFTPRSKALRIPQTWVPRDRKFSSQPLDELRSFISKEEIQTPTSLPQPFKLRLAVKDNIATSTLPTTCGSSILSHHVSPFEATIVSQLRWRGYMVVGKTNLDQFGMGSHSTNSHFGTVHTAAHDLSAGGSSGGSAVAVAQGDADLALGTDTGGSVRLPAAYTGTVGYKPSYGMISRWGVVPYANSLDTVGFLATNVQKIATTVTGPSLLYLEHDSKDPTSLSPGTRRRCTAQREGYATTPSSLVPPTNIQGLTFGVPLEYNISELSPSIRSAWISAASTLRRLGATVVPVSLPSTKHALSAYYILAPAEASSNLSKYDGIRYGTRSDSDLHISSTLSSSPDQLPTDMVEDDLNPPTTTTTTTTTTTKTLYASTRGDHFGLEAQRRILLGSYTLSSEAMDNHFVQAQRVRRLVRRDFDRIFALANPLLDDGPEQQFDLPDLSEDVVLENKLGPHQVDFLLCPTAPTTAPRLEDVEMAGVVDTFVNDVFTVPASLAGLPAVSVPFQLREEEVVVVDGEKEKGMAGLQLVGQFWDDARLLSVADTLMKSVAERE